MNTETMRVAFERLCVIIYVWYKPIIMGNNNTVLTPHRVVSYVWSENLELYGAHVTFHPLQNVTINFEGYGYTYVYKKF